jgi:hypothetical protein
VRYLRMLGLCAVAACAIAVATSASASAALPEWGKCVKVPVTIKGKEHTKGKYANSNCTEKTGGEYEFLKGTAELPSTEFVNNMTSSEAVLETADGVQVKCTGQSAKGHLSGTKEVSGVEVKFTGCQANLLELKCENEFKFNEETGKYEYVEGEIFTRELKGKLGYISGKGTATPVVGLELEPEKKEGLFAFFGCGSKEGGAPILFSNVGEKPGKEKGGDAIISPISPINQMGKETIQTYKEKTKENTETHEIEKEKGIQEPSAFENEKPAYLETQILDGFGEITWAKSGQEETAVTKLVSEEELEIKA